MYNNEHYSDPTAEKAIENLQKERITKLIDELKSIIRKNDFELMGRIVVKDNKTGKIYK